MMIGRQLEDYFPSHVAGKAGDEALRVEALSSPAGFSDVSFTVRAGEVLGFAGLVGAGRSEVAQARVRTRPARERPHLVGGKPRRSWTARRARLPPASASCRRTASGRAWCCRWTCSQNATLSILPRLARLGFISRPVERTAAAAVLRAAER